MFCVWCGIGAQEKLGIAAGGSIQQGFLMRVALQNRQAIEMRTNATDEHVIAVVQQVMRGDGRADICGSLAHELRRIAGGDVFKHQFERWELRYDAH